MVRDKINKNGHRTRSLGAGLTKMCNNIDMLFVGYRNVGVVLGVRCSLVTNRNNKGKINLGRMS